MSLKMCIRDKIRPSCQLDLSVKQLPQALLLAHGDILFLNEETAYLKAVQLGKQAVVKPVVAQTLQVLDFRPGRLDVAKVSQEHRPAPGQQQRPVTGVKAGKRCV